MAISSRTYQVYEVVRVAQLTEDVSEDDLLSMAEAAELAGTNLNMIGDRMDNGTLRWFQMSPTLGQGVKRRVLRVDAEALRDELKAKRRKAAARK